MPFILTANVYPALGKQPEVRKILEERVRQIQSSGLRANLATTGFGDDPHFYVNLNVADLSAADAYRAGPLAPANDPAFVAKIGLLLRQPARNELWETVIVAPPAPTSAPTRYNLRARVFPQPAAGRKLMALFSDRIKGEVAKGVRVGLARPVAGAPGEFATSRFFTSLADLEKYRAAAEADPDRQKFVEQITPLFAKPTNFEIREILIPMPAA